MDTKLTLRLDKEIIDRIKIYASKQHKSLSALTEDLYKIYMLKDENRDELELITPIARKYKGIIDKTSFDVDNSKYQYLREKHIK